MKYLFVRVDTLELVQWRLSESRSRHFTLQSNVIPKTFFIYLYCTDLVPDYI